MQQTAAGSGPERDELSAARAPGARLAGDVVERDEQPGQIGGFACLAAFTHGTHFSAPERPFL